MAVSNQFIADPITSASTLLDGTGATLAFTAAADIFVFEIRVQPLGGNNRAVARVWLNNGSDLEMADNNVLIAEAGVPQSNASQTEANPATVITLKRFLSSGERLYVAMSQNALSGWDVSVFAGDDYDQILRGTI